MAFYQKIAASAFIALALLLTGCKSSDQAPNSQLGGVEFTGSSKANELLKADTLRTISMYMKALGCDKIEHVDTNVLSYEPSNGTKGHQWGKEDWKVTGCGKPYPFIVEFIEDGVGGTYMSIYQP